MKCQVKVLCGLLAVLMLASAACANKVDDTSSETKVTTANTDDTDETTTARIEPELPDENFENYTFRVLTKGKENVHWKSKDIYAEALNGEAINDAVYNRNVKIGEKYGFAIEEIATSKGTWDLYTDTKKSVMASSDDYDMVAISLQTDFNTLANAEMLVDLNTVTYMDLSKPWYDQNANEQISIANKLYATVGDMLVMDNEATISILFSKKLVTDYQLGDFYSKVADGTWTLDFMRECMVKVTADLNGDAKHDEYDQWGVIGEYLNTMAYIVGAGETSVAKDEDDLPYFTLQNERFYDAFTKAVNINRDYDYCMYADNFSGYSDVWAECIDKAFSEDRVLFNTAGLVRVTVFRSMENDFGILPMPKMDDAQEKYHNMVSAGCSNSIAIPITASDLERTGIIIEALSAESMYTLTPAYYDISVKGKATRDTESEEMLDLIFANRVYDLGYMYNWGSIIDAVNGLTTSGNVTSSIEKKMKAAQIAIEKTIDKYTTME